MEFKPQSCSKDMRTLTGEIRALEVGASQCIVYNLFHDYGHLP